MGVYTAVRICSSRRSRIKVMLSTAVVRACGPLDTDSAMAEEPACTAMRGIQSTDWMFLVSGSAL